MLVRIASVALAAGVAMAAFSSLARDSESSHRYYRSSDGSEVHGPTKEDNSTYGKPTADCRDGTHSYSHHHNGTCSGHGGVADWRQ